MERFHFIGLGNGGANALEFFFHHGMEGKFTCITNGHTWYQDKVETNLGVNLERPSFPNGIRHIPYVPLGNPRTFSYQENDSDRFRNDKGELIIPGMLSDLIEPNETFVLLSGIGGYTAAYLTEAFTQRLYRKEKNFLTISWAPFSFEGSQKTFRAQKVSTKLSSTTNFQYFNCQNMIKELGNLHLEVAFKMVDKKAFELYLSIDH